MQLPQFVMECNCIKSATLEKAQPTVLKKFYQLQLAPNLQFFQF